MNSLTSFLKDKGEAVPSLRALNDDFACIVGTYLFNDKENKAEYNITCPLSELSLIDVEKDGREKVYRKTSAKKINPYIALSLIVRENEGKSEIAINDLRAKENSICKIFNLDVIELLDILSEIEKFGEIKIIRTAGLDVIRLLNAKKSEDYILQYYKELTGEN